MKATSFVQKLQNVLIHIGYQLKSLVAFLNAKNKAINRMKGENFFGADFCYHFR